MLKGICLRCNVEGIGKIDIAASRRWTLRLENWRNLEPCRVTSFIKCRCCDNLKTCADALSSPVMGLTNDSPYSESLAIIKEMACTMMPARCNPEVSADALSSRDGVVSDEGHRKIGQLLTSPARPLYELQRVSAIRWSADALSSRPSIDTPTTATMSICSDQLAKPTYHSYGCNKSAMSVFTNTRTSEQAHFEPGIYHHNHLHDCAKSGVPADALSSRDSVDLTHGHGIIGQLSTSPAKPLYKLQR